MQLATSAGFKIPRRIRDMNKLTNKLKIKKVAVNMIDLVLAG